MAYTLISFVGIGMYKEGYLQTTYNFSDNQRITTHLFLNALLEAKYRNVSKIILIGTVTSAWDMLVEVDDDLWIRTCDAKENNAINNELMMEVQNYLSNKLNIPVVIKCHTDIIDIETSEDLFNLYSSIIPEITDENILLDITHSFRSMPILLYQALQFSITQNTVIKNVEIVYGEYVESKKLSYVRNLSQYWKYSQISDALNVFKEKLDGYKLANLIQDDWLDGAKVIIKLSDIVQTNFSLQIFDVAKQIKNVLKKSSDYSPKWLEDVRAFLEEIYKCITVEPMYNALYNYANFLYERKLNVQAVITLQVAVEVFIAEINNNSEMIGNYDWWQDEGRKKLNKIKGKNWKDIGGPLTNLESFRNQIAHGGGTNKDGNFPQAANIVNIFKSGKKGVENLFKSK